MQTLLRFWGLGGWKDFRVDARCYTEKKKWSQNGSTPGTVSWCVIQLEPWHYFGATFKGRAVCVIVTKPIIFLQPNPDRQILTLFGYLMSLGNLLHPPRWHCFLKGLQGGAVLAPLFFSVYVVFCLFGFC